MHLIALKWISGSVDVRRNSTSLSRPPFLWISCTLSLSHRQLENTRKASTWRSSKSCRDTNKSLFLSGFFLIIGVKTKLFKCTTTDLCVQAYVQHYWGCSSASQVPARPWRQRVCLHWWWHFAVSLKPSSEWQGSLTAAVQEAGGWPPTCAPLDNTWGPIKDILRQAQDTIVIFFLTNYSCQMWIIITNESKKVLSEWLQPVFFFIWHCGNGKRNGTRLIYFWIAKWIMSVSMFILTAPILIPISSAKLQDCDLIYLNHVEDDFQWILLDVAIWAGQELD